MEGWAIIGLGLASLGLGVVLFDRWERRRRLQDIQAAFDQRTKLDPDEWFEEHFSGTPIPRDVADKIRAVFEEIAESDLSRLRSRDRFGHELKFIWAYDSMADVEIVTSIESEFKITFTGPVLDETKTFRDLGCLVWARMNSQGGLSTTRLS